MIQAALIGAGALILVSTLEAVLQRPVEEADDTHQPAENSTSTVAQTQEASTTNKTDNQITVTDSPDTVIITGDHNTVEKLDIPEPSFILDNTGQKNLAAEIGICGVLCMIDIKGYKTIMDLEIDYSVAVHSLLVKAVSSNVYAINILPIGASTMESYSVGGSGTAYFQIKNPDSFYKLEIYTMNPVTHPEDEIQIIFN